MFGCHGSVHLIDKLQILLEVEASEIGSVLGERDGDKSFLKIDWNLHTCLFLVKRIPLRCPDSRAGEESAITAVDHAVIGGVVAVVVFAMLCLLIILGRYFARHKGTYFTHEAKGADDAADADTAIINAEGGQNNSEEKKEYFI
ncbi:UNVERIFIED_CONTAM: hypothetical protein K2H54_004360 [Gekko kuhli]